MIASWHVWHVWLVWASAFLVPSRVSSTSPRERDSLRGFGWLTPGGFAIGLAEAFLYGAYAGLVLGPLYSTFARRFGRPAH